MVPCGWERNWSTLLLLCPGWSPSRIIFCRSVHNSITCHRNEISLPKSQAQLTTHNGESKLLYISLQPFFVWGHNESLLTFREEIIIEYHINGRWCAQNNPFTRGPTVLFCQTVLHRIYFTDRYMESLALISQACMTITLPQAFQFTRLYDSIFLVWVCFQFHECRKLIIWCSLAFD